MKAVVWTAYGSPDVLQLREIVVVGVHGTSWIAFGMDCHSLWQRF